MFVITADQDASTTRGDRVEDLLAGLRDYLEDRPEGVTLPFERTVGDEVQAVLHDATATVGLALHLQRLDGWAVGVGAGPVAEPLAATPRASSGPAFIHARQAVERARGRGVRVPLVVAGEDEHAAAHASALLQLLGAVVRRRTRAGWEATDLVAAGLTQREAAARLGVSEQAVSQRLAAALHDEERALHPLAAELLRAAEGGTA